MLDGWRRVDESSMDTAVHSHIYTYVTVLAGAGADSGAVLVTPRIKHIKRYAEHIRRFISVENV